MPEQIARSRSGLRAKPIRKEQRVQTRYACSGDITFQPLGNRTVEVWSAAKVTNISTKGMGLVLDTPIERGTILSVKLRAAGRRFSRPLLLRVVRVVERPAEVWQVGCTFAIPLDEDELSALLRMENASHPAARPNHPADLDVEKKPHTGAPASLSGGSVLERRCVHRRHLSAEVVLASAPGWQETVEALALDGSIGGLKVLSPKPFARGTILQVRSKDISQTDAVADICVKRCQAQQSMWILGVQFVQPPPAVLLQVLGCVEPPKA